MWNKYYTALSVLVCSALIFQLAEIWAEKSLQLSAWFYSSFINPDILMQASVFWGFFPKCRYSTLSVAWYY